MAGLFISWVVGAITCTTLLYTHPGDFNVQFLGLVSPPSAYALFYLLYLISTSHRR